MNLIPLARGVTLAASALLIAACTTTSTRHPSTEFSAPIPATAQIVLPTPLVPVTLPAFPQELRRQRAAELVELDVVVDHQGNVLYATIHRSSNFLINAPALAAVGQWKFRPGTRDGTPADMHVIVPIRFQPVD